MARYGEGDKRWIVEERPDGTNVHNWHWAETNCLPWSKTFFANNLSNLVLLNEEPHLFLKIKSVDRVNGEAYVNIRKGKIIPGYEISLTLSWEGQAEDCGGKSVIKANGTVEIPYISDENADEDPEIKVSVKEKGPIGVKLKEVMISKGKVLILEKVRIWVQSMAKGGPVQESLEKKKVLPRNVLGKNENVGVEKECKEGCKVISLTERFNCRAIDLYEILMDDNRWRGFTQCNARISKEVGGEFSIFDGSVKGSNVELQEAKLIVQKWRFESWPDGVQSLVRLVFEEPEPGVTIINLTHTDVPIADRYGNATMVENTERGWRDLIFHKIKTVFGFGM